MRWRLWAMLVMGLGAAARAAPAPPPAPAARYTVRTEARTAAVTARIAPDGQPYPAPGRTWTVSMACEEADDGSRPTRCVQAALAVHPKRALARFFACYQPAAHPLAPARARALADTILASNPQATLPEAAGFGIDSFLVLMRWTTWERRPITGPRPRCKGMDCNMVPPPIIGYRHVATTDEGWGWVNGTTWVQGRGTPFEPRPVKLHLIDPVQTGATESRPLAAAARLAYDDDELAKLASAADPMVRFAALQDLAVQALVRGDPARARSLLAPARQSLAAAQALTDKPDALSSALAELTAALDIAADTAADPCAARP